MSLQQERVCGVRSNEARAAEYKDLLHTLGKTRLR
jgi:hypothetical protein